MPSQSSPPMSKTRGEVLSKKLLGIDPHERYKRYPPYVEQRAREALTPAAAQPFFEEEPTVAEFLRRLRPTGQGAVRYCNSLFPSLGWLPRYNWRWLLGDSIAGLTIGFVVIPQAMAYALLAQLSPEYGLYTSFTGAVSYWLFGTSKDIVIGTTAVGSLLVGSIVTKIRHAVESGELGQDYSNEEIARTLSLIAGSILLFFGLFRLGWIIEFIPYVPISAFVTAASITIMATQAPVALGIKGVNTREAPYKVIINTLKGLPDTQLDAAIGLSCLVMLFMIRDFCAHMEKRQSRRKRMWTTISSLRQTFAMILYTIIAYLVHMDVPAAALDDETGRKFRLVGTIERGFSKARVPRPDTKLISHIIPEMPAIVIILIIEHIAIAKSFGRIFNYTIVPSQEILAQGTANVFSPFVGGYVCTGSFGASAVLSKAGVRTPLAGLFSAFILVLALYALTGVFYYIPNAALAGLIIHAVSNLLTPPRSLYKYWLLSPLELIIWIVGVVLALFETLETSIYATTALSAVLLLVRLSRTQGRFLGKVTVHPVPNSDDQKNSDFSSAHARSDCEKGEIATANTTNTRDAFLPLDRNDPSNPAIDVESPYPGVFIYRFSEGFNYANSGQHAHRLLAHVTSNTRRTTAERYAKESDRLWNDDGASRPSNAHLPLLRAIVLDCSAVNNIDITAVQALVDLRDGLDSWASPEPVEWHFAALSNRWTRRALSVAEFGFPAADNDLAGVHWRPSYVVVAPVTDALAAEKDASSHLGRGRGGDKEQSHVLQVQQCVITKKNTAAAQEDEDDSYDVASAAPPVSKTLASHHPHPACPGSTAAVLYGVDRPFFHLDLATAVEAAVRDARRADERYSEERYLIAAAEEEARALHENGEEPVGVPITPADSRVANP